VVVVTREGKVGAALQLAPGHVVAANSAVARKSVEKSLSKSSAASPRSVLETVAAGSSSTGSALP
jgi:hypothetical protein